MDNMTPKTFIETVMAQRIQANAEKAKGVNAVFQYEITGDNGGHWIIDLTPEHFGVREGKADRADCTLTMQSQDFVDMMSGKLNGQTAYMSGKLQIGGDMSLALKLAEVSAPA